MWRRRPFIIVNIKLQSENWRMKVKRILNLILTYLLSTKRLLKMAQDPDRVVGQVESMTPRSCLDLLTSETVSSDLKLTLLSEKWIQLTKWKRILWCSRSKETWLTLFLGPLMIRYQRLQSLMLLQKLRLPRKVMLDLSRPGDPQSPHILPGMRPPNQFLSEMTRNPRLWRLTKNCKCFEKAEDQWVLAWMTRKTHNRCTLWWRKPLKNCLKHTMITSIKYSITWTKVLIVHLRLSISGKEVKVLITRLLSIITIYWVSRLTKLGLNQLVIIRDKIRQRFLKGLLQINQKRDLSKLIPPRLQSVALKPQVSCGNKFRHLSKLTEERTLIHLIWHLKIR